MAEKYCKSALHPILYLKKPGEVTQANLQALPCVDFKGLPMA